MSFDQDLGESTTLLTLFKLLLLKCFASIFCERLRCRTDEMVRSLKQLTASRYTSEVQAAVFTSQLLDNEAVSHCVKEDLFFLTVATIQIQLPGGERKKERR
jgi:hypothetical protein